MGSNLGDRAGYLRAALRELPHQGIRVRRVSSIYETEPVGLKGQPAFLNLAVKGETRLGPQALLRAVQAIEARLGRQRSVRWGPRTLDIDILFYGRRRIRRRGLQVPHPRLAERRFVLAPLAEIAPGLVHTGRRRTVRTLLRDCPDMARVESYCQA